MSKNIGITQLIIKTDIYTWLLHMNMQFVAIIIINIIIAYFHHTHTHFIFITPNLHICIFFNGFSIAAMEFCTVPWLPFCSYFLAAVVLWSKPVNISFLSCLYSECIVQFDLYSWFGVVSLLEATFLKWNYHVFIFSSWFYFRH